MYYTIGDILKHHFVTDNRACYQKLYAHSDNE